MYLHVCARDDMKVVFKTLGTGWDYLAGECVEEKRGPKTKKQNPETPQNLKSSAEKEKPER